MTVETWLRAKTRSIATTSGPWISIHSSATACTARSRRSNGSSAVVRTTSTSNATTDRPGAVSINASPHRVNPGSTPMTRITTSRRPVVEPTFETLPVVRQSGVERREHVVGNVDVRVDVLDVVRVLQRVDEGEHLARAVGVDGHLDRGAETGLRRLVVDPGRLARTAHLDQVGGLADHLELLTQVVDLLRAGVEDGHEHVVLGELTLVQQDLALAGEHVRHRAGVGEIASVTGHGHAHLTGGAVAVVRQTLDQQGHAVRTVALVHDGLPLGAARLLAGTPLPCTLDVVRGDGVLLGLLDGVEERGVAGRVAPAGAGCHLDVLDQLGEELAALGVDRRLLVLGGGPLGMACHVFFRPPGVSGVREAQRACPARGLAGHPVYEVAARTMSRKYWCTRTSVVTSGWKDVARASPWRTATTWSRPSDARTLASTSTSGPTVSTHGARMNTVRSGSG